jgi:archaellum biogenesis ATPase FlaH
MADKNLKIKIIILMDRIIHRMARNIHGMIKVVPETDSNSNKKDTWKTNISKVYWNMDGTIEEAKLCLGAEEPRAVSWFDELFINGIEVFEDSKDSKDFPKTKEQHYPVTMLLKGPPGDGKTTLAMELCHHLAECKKKIKSTYISLESEKKQILDTLTGYGWKYNEEDPLLNVYGLEYTIKWTEKLSTEDIKIRANRISILPEMVMNLFRIPYSESIKEIIANICSLLGFREVGRGIHNKSDFKILVIDSLNIIPIESRTKIFLDFLKIAKRKRSNIKLIIFVLDGKSDNDYNPFWEYMCDTIIELNHHYENDYLIKTIEIVKSRFQKHILGKHQIKIYGKPASLEKENTVSRTHPCIKEGGIFIFPSVHFYLSKYNKFSQSGTLQYEATRPESFNNFLKIQSDGGFPKGRCTALIGCRGGHKSHLAYLHILARLTGKYKNRTTSDAFDNAALIISLRDDETMISSTLDGILEKEIQSNEWKKTDFLLEENRMEILYYPPGYISPEEFTHRIFVSIHKLKKKCKNVTVIFNSLDQLAARFPLCAKFDIFIPSIVQILIGEAITSIFIAVDEKDQPVEQYGLLPMADLILSFHKYKISVSDYNKIMSAKTKTGTKVEMSAGTDVEETRDEIIITVERFAGGKKAGAKGLLELVYKENEEQKSDKKLPCLEFAKLPPEVYLDKDKRTD